MTAAGASVAPPLRLWLRLEGAAVLALALVLYQRADYSWLTFAWMFLLPDVSFAAYLAGPRIGSWAYNALHSYIGPIVLCLLLLAGGHTLAVPLVWSAHIGFDRLLGYGLKYPSSFGDTHLGRTGRAPSDESRTRR